MRTRKICISVLLIMALTVMAIVPLFASDNIILIQDTYYYSQNDTYITSLCGTSAGEADRHRAVAVAISSAYGSTTGYGSIHAFHSSASATQYIGNHADDYHNYYQRESEIGN